MSAATLTPTEALAQYLQLQNATRYCVAYSAGMDSHVLLHVAAELLSERDDVELRAVHINHGMQDESDQWVRHAEFICDGLGIPLTIGPIWPRLAFPPIGRLEALQEGDASRNVTPPGMPRCR